MIAITDLHGMAREYQRAAKLLRTQKSSNVAVYLCGYAVEIALKARICRTLKWTTGFPENTAEFKAKSSLKTHDLEGLLEFTGIQSSVKIRYFADWAIVNKWNPEQRYSRPGTKTLSEADDMIQATQNLLKVLL
jgi:HEPN domain-containing protein